MCRLIKQYEINPLSSKQLPAQNFHQLRFFLQGDPGNRQHLTAPAQGCGKTVIAIQPRLLGKTDLFLLMIIG